jgi:hypothetical protein
MEKKIQKHLSGFLRAYNVSSTILSYTFQARAELYSISLYLFLETEL